MRGSMEHPQPSFNPSIIALPSHAMSQSKLPHGSDYLCERCNQMTMTLPGLRALASKEGYQHLSIGELRRSADRGCPMCIGLRNSHKHHTFSHYAKPYLRIFSSVNLLMKFDFKNDILPESVGHPFETARLVALRSALWDDNINLETERFRLSDVSSLSTFTGIGDPAENYLRVKDISIPIVRNLTVQNVKAFLADCHTGHNHCPKAAPTTLPSRVIDVGLGGKPHVLLHITQPHEKAEYLALSYPWGGPQEIKTTTATLSRWRLSIPIDTLPLTLQDAIAVTRDLGFRYLWVDALCIIQDDNDDKVAEINRMGAIYKNSTLTIAAANTTSVQESFLSPRPIPATWSVPYLLPNGAFGNLWVSASYPELISSPLDSRAWALQESLLSPRVLWYGPTALKWKCQTTKFRDVHEATVNHWSYPGVKHHRLPSGVFGIAEHTSSDLRNQQSIIWKKVVEDYSGRDITFPDDRLPALAGIASELQKLWQDDYAAGMWRSCLVKHLAWYRTSEDVSPPAEGNSSNLHLPSTYQSPGWSWIWLEGEVTVMEVFSEHAQVVECNVTLVDNTAPLSRVRDGRLVLKAACIDEEQRLKTNYGDCWFQWDHNQCFEQDNINRDFRYSLLGYKEMERHQNDFSERKGIALVLAPAGDGTFMRIGTVFGFSTENWPIEALEQQIITII